MQNKVVEIFNKEPECGWGCHGDAYLWNVLRGCFVFDGEIRKTDDFEKALCLHYKEVIGKELKSDLNGSWSELAFRSGFAPGISTDWWIYRAIPLLRDRFEKFVGDCTGGFLDIRILLADITKRDEDIIVNPTNEQLKPGGGVCGAIHKAAGSELATACSHVSVNLNGVRCKVGSAVLTDAFKLKCKKICHVVPPNAQRGITDGEKDDLRSCYLNAMMNVRDHKPYGSIAFPSVGTGKLAFPAKEAAEIAAEVI